MSIPFDDVTLGSKESSAELARRARNNTGHRGHTTHSHHPLVTVDASIQSKTPELATEITSDITRTTPQRGGRGS